jgi:hypothetical protein
MAAPATLSAKPARRFWGWGFLDDGLSAAETEHVHRLLAQLPGGLGQAVPEPREED